jgi:two-component system response regulator AtoC
VAPPTGVDAPRGAVVLVEDDRGVATLVAAILEGAGYAVRVCGDGASARRALAAAEPDVLCLDLGLPDVDGRELIGELHQRHRDLPIVVLTADDQIDTVVAAMRAGAYDYLVKPIERDTLIRTVADAAARRAGPTRGAAPTAPPGYHGLIGTSAPMRALIRELEQVAPTDITLLILGESGTGKELVARAIHDRSARRDRPFVAVNCAAIPESLHEAELFGHERGAFTGASARAPGRFEQAHTGTLFLDEVAELSPALQSKLLRVLQERRFHRIGGASELEVDIRVIAATHRDLDAAVRAERFREDLFYRLAVFELELPPLRARADDVPILAEAFVARFADELGRPLRLAPEALACLQAYHWPGNVRELQNAIHRAAVATTDGVIAPGHLPRRVAPTVPTAPAPGPSPDGGGPAAGALEQAERATIAAALARHQHNLTQVARELGIGRTTLYRKLKRYDLG